MSRIVPCNMTLSLIIAPTVEIVKGIFFVSPLSRGECMTFVSRFAVHLASILTYNKK